MKIYKGLNEKYLNPRHIIGLRQDNVSHKHFESAMIFLSCLVLAIGLLMFSCQAAHAYSDEQAILAVIGEAENQGYQGMKAIACGIRNRGTLKGVYGLNSPRVKKHKYSENTAAQAMVAWETSDDPDQCRFLGGADHWENVKAFGKPTWASEMVETYRYKDHVFYKEVL